MQLLMLRLLMNVFLLLDVVRFWPGVCCRIELLLLLLCVDATTTGLLQIKLQFSCCYCVLILQLLFWFRGYVPLFLVLCLLACYLYLPSNKEERDSKSIRDGLYPLNVSGLVFRYGFSGC